MGKKQRELFISRVSEIMTGLYSRLAEVSEIELKRYQEEADRFYGSRKTRQTNIFAEIWSKRTKCLQKELYETTEEYVKLVGSDAEQAFQRTNGLLEEVVNFSVESFYYKVLLGFLSLSDLTSEDREDIVRAEREALKRFDKRWRSVESIARKKYLKSISEKSLKPVRILYGTYGEYNKCIGYDEEFCVYLGFFPDDNYYHWGDYKILIITKNHAESIARKVFDFPETNIDVLNEILDYESSIKPRIIK